MSHSYSGYEAQTYYADANASGHGYDNNNFAVELRDSPAAVSQHSLNTEATVSRHYSAKSSSRHEQKHQSSSSSSSSSSSGRRSERSRGSVSGNGDIQDYSSKVEEEMRRAKKPIEVNSRERKTVLDTTGVWLNKQEEENWKGKLSLSQYEINDDSNPEVIKKRVEDKIVYNQEVAIKCLRPPPLKPAEIVIKEVNPNSEEAPPIIIRQVPDEPCGPGQNVVREQPPKAPKLVENKVIKIPGKPAPPPKRRVIIEKLPNIPEKPESILVEKWTGYGPQKINVRYERAGCSAEKSVRNLIIEWDGADYEIKKECKNLGCEEADPEEYLRKYGSEIGRGNADKALEGCCFDGCDSTCNKSDEGKYVLEGDVDALSLVDLEKEGLGFLREFVKGGSSGSSGSSRRRRSQDNSNAKSSSSSSRSGGCPNAKPKPKPSGCQKVKKTCGN